MAASTNPFPHCFPHGFPDGFLWGSFTSPRPLLAAGWWEDPETRTNGAALAAERQPS